MGFLQNILDKAGSIFRVENDEILFFILVFLFLFLDNTRDTTRTEDDETREYDGISILFFAAIFLLFFFNSDKSCLKE